MSVCPAHPGVTVKTSSGRACLIRLPQDAPAAWAFGKAYAAAALFGSQINCALPDKHEESEECGRGRQLSAGLDTTVCRAA